MRYDLEMLPKETYDSVLRREAQKLGGIEIRDVSFEGDRVLVFQVAQDGETLIGFHQMLIPGWRDQPDLFKTDLETLHSKEVVAENFDDMPREYKNWWKLSQKTKVPVDADVYHIPEHMRKIGNQIYSPLRIPGEIVVGHGVDYGEPCTFYLVDPEIFDRELTPLESWANSTYYASLSHHRKSDERLEMDLQAFEVKHGATQHFVFRKSV